MTTQTMTATTLALPTKFSSGGRHNRHHSWPPIQLRPSHLEHHHKYAHKTRSDSIDDDPFAFFLSAEDNDEDEAYVSDWMNATYKEAPRSKRSKSASPSRQRSGTETANTQSVDRDSPRSAIWSLTQWLERMEKMYFTKKTTPQETELRQKSPEMLPTPLPVLPHSRGRKKFRRTSVAVGNRAVRSHSGRPRVWQEPGVAIYTLSEEAEFDEFGLGISI